MRLTVTLARQLGCGGSDLGRRLAENLHARCLDREIVSHAAARFELEEADLAAREERCSSFWERMLRGISTGPPEALYQAPPPPLVLDHELFTAETEMMKAIAAGEDCVIVGRAASHVLPTHSGMVNIFLYAPLQFRVRRIMAGEGIADEAQARALILRSDESRRKFITQMTGRTLDDARNYHLCVDTSSLPLPQIADLLTDFIRHKTATA